MHARCRRQREECRRRRRRILSTNMTPNLTGDWIDISAPLRNGMVAWPGDAPFQKTPTLEIAKGHQCNLSEFSTTAHIGTHMDAPRHFIDGGATIDRMPIEATVGRARVIEIKDPEMIRKTEVEFYKPQRGERLLFKTRNSSHAWKTNTFQETYIYIPPDTAAYLASAGVMTWTGLRPDLRCPMRSETSWMIPAADRRDESEPAAGTFTMFSWTDSRSEASPGISIFHPLE